LVRKRFSVQGLSPLSCELDCSRKNWEKAYIGALNSCLCLLNDLSKKPHS
jgi:hypothetical protein